MYASFNHGFPTDFQRVLPLPKIPDKKTLMNNKINRIRNHQLFRIISQLVLYSGLLFIVYTISYESRDPRSFELKNHVSKMFTFSKVRTCRERLMHNMNCDAPNESRCIYQAPNEYYCIILCPQQDVCFSSTVIAIRVIHVYAQNTRGNIKKSAYAKAMLK